MSWKINILLLVMVLPWLKSLPAFGASPSATDLVKAELVAGTTAVEAGKPFVVGVRLEIADGWHVYWLNPGDAGSATTVKFSVPPGFSVGELKYPVPEKLPQPGGLVVYSYEKELLLTAQVTPPADAKGLKSAEVTVQVGWCVCNPERCLIGKKTLTISLPMVENGHAQAANAVLFAAWQKRVARPAEDAFSVVKMHQIAPTLQEIDLTWIGAPASSRFEWLPGPCSDLKIESQSIQTQGRTTRVLLKIDPVQGIPADSSTISGILAYYDNEHPPLGVSVVVDRPAALLTVKVKESKGE